MGSLLSQLRSGVERPKRHGLPVAVNQAITATLVALVVMVTACRPRAPRDEAPLDLRGDPILPLANTPAGSTLALPGASARVSSLETESFSDDSLGLVGFDRLAGYDYEASAATLAAEGKAGATAIPQSIRALDGTEVAVRGFMLPLKIDGGLVREFLLMRDQSMCCFGIVPNINDWVSVSMSPPGVKAIMDQPVIIFGTFDVGEVYDHGMLSSIYRMEGEELLDALDL